MLPFRRPEPFEFNNRLFVSTKLALVVLGVLWLARLLLLLSYPEEFESLGGRDLIGAWLTGLRFDGATIAEVFGVPLVLMNMPGKVFEGRWWFDSLAWASYLLLLIASLILAGDLLYFGEVHRHVAFEAGALWSERELLLRAAAARGWLLAVFALFAGFLFLAWRRALRVERVPAGNQTLGFLAVATVLFALAHGSMRERPIAVIDAFSTGDSAHGQIALNGIFTAWEFLYETPDSVSHHFFELKDALRRLRPENDVGDPRYPMSRHFAAHPTGHNVVVVLLESWDFKYVDALARNGYGATPEFDRLVRGGRAWPRFYAVGERSFDGVVNTLTGVPALRGTYVESFGTYSVTRLAELARRHGYATIFAESSDEESMNLSQLTATLGFEEFYGRQSIPLRLKYPDADASPCGWDYDMLMFAKERFDRFDRPFFAFLFTGTTHDPYPPLPEQFSRSASGDNESHYLATLRYADWSIGEFMRAASSSPWFKNTIFIFTADHTNRLQRGNDYFENHHTPFVIYAPGIVAPGNDERVGSQLDILPTIVDLLGFGDPYSSPGNSLLRPGAGEAFVSSRGITIGLIGPRAFVVHDLSQRLGAKALVPGVTEAELNQMEQRLLSTDQVIFELARTNRWAP